MHSTSELKYMESYRYTIYKSIVEENKSIQQLSKELNIPKSTITKCINEYIKKWYPDTYYKIIESLYQQKLSYDDEIYFLIVEDNLTIREASAKLGISKSSLHKYIHNELRKNYNANRYTKICDTLDYHFKYKHINGGQATKQKYTK